jgi:methyl-accepting chemotaxis protein
VDGIFFYSIDKNEIDEKFIITDTTPAKECEKPKENDSNGKISKLEEDLHSLKMISGNYFQSISEGITELSLTLKKVKEKQDNFERRITEIEKITDSTVDELTNIILEILQNANEDPKMVKKNLVKEVGENSVMITLQKVKSVIEKKNRSSKYIDKIDNVLKLL